MKFLASILLIALVGAASVKAAPSSTIAQANMDKSLINYLMEPSASAIASADPAVSAACFGKYLPILSEVANTFSVQYQACITVANERTANLTAQAALSRGEFIQDTNTICSSFQGCGNDTDVLGFFNCYASVSTQEVSQMYDISTDAATAANNYSQGLKLIQEESDQCTNATERTYVTNTASTYDLLDKCLETGLPDSDAATTEEPAVTDEPEATTAAAVEMQQFFVAPQEASVPQPASVQVPRLTPPLLRH